jgi:hypothetical protein
VKGSKRNMRNRLSGIKFKAYRRRRIQVKNPCPSRNAKNAIATAVTPGNTT